MEKAPLLSVSGLRGIVGETLTPPVILRYTAAFADLEGPGLYLLGRDTRPHGEMVRSTVLSALLAKGISVVDLGIVPTPTLFFLVKPLKAQGGIVITASHNPMEWNALKFAHREGRSLFEEEIEALRRKAEEVPTRTSIERTGTVEIREDAQRFHGEKILDLPYVTLKALKNRRFKVAVDTVGGAAFKVLPALLRELGAEVIELHSTPGTTFPHPPEPRREHLHDLQALLKKGTADLGLAVDPDGDRILFGVRGKGLLTEEHTLPLLARWILRFKKGPIVTNLSTSMLIEEVAASYGVPLYRTPVGEANVLKEALHRRAVLGGEGNGGILLPDFNQCRDGLLAAALFLSLAAEEGPDAIGETFPEYPMIKKKYPRPKELQKEEIIAAFKDAEVDLRDGLYLRFKEAFLHLRPSNTEPILRVHVEARDEKVAQTLLRRIEAFLS